MSDDGKSAYMNASDEAKKVYATQMTAYNLTLVEPVANATIVGVPSVVIVTVMMMLFKKLLFQQLLPNPNLLRRSL